MGGFRYKHGDRPLEGYTIQRAAGRGGFGEVYYALSDSGREVALKMISGYEQIELRGVGNCMNLKSPHLVSIFDVKHNGDGVPFVIMEYVSGPSLRQLLDESPAGIGAQKTAFFLREMGKGLAYLHECGIVHRDLKPGNIFYENGYVKIGDYGLSKAMSASPHSGQTVTVGTVHYMAPEIGMGKYDQGIDIYALGAVVYEMLTGQVPFLGSSPSEILMKHMTSEVDVKGIEEPFATVIRKCMAKDPAQRYQSVQEVVEAVFGAEHVRESVSCFSPESLSMVAQRVANRVASGGKSDTPVPMNAGGVAVAERPAGGGDLWDRMGGYVDRAGDRISKIGGRVADAGVKMIPGAARRLKSAALGDEGDGAVNDSLSRRQRRMLALILLFAFATATGILGRFDDRDGFPAAWFGALTMIGGAVMGLALTREKILPQIANESAAVLRLTTGGMASAGLLLLSFPVFAACDGRVLQSLAMGALAIVVPLFGMDWIEFASPSRKERVSFGHAFYAALFGFIVCIFLPGDNGALTIGVLAGISLVAQVLSPWDSRRATSVPNVREAGGDQEDEDESDDSGWADWAEEKERLGSSTALAVDPNALTVMAAAVPPPLPRIRRPVPSFMRWLWLAGCVAALPSGILMEAALGIDPNPDPDTFVALAGGGAALILLGLLCFVKSFQKRHRGWFGYLIRPVLMWACAGSIIVAGTALGRADLSKEGGLFALSMIIVPAVILVLLPILALFRFTDPAPVITPPPLPAPVPVPATAMKANLFIPAVDAAAAEASASSEAQTLPPRASEAPARPARRERSGAGQELMTFMEPGMWKFHALAAVGYPLLIAAGLLGAAMAIDVPGMIFLREPGSNYANHGPPPSVIRLGGSVLTWAGMFAACVLIMIARRPGGILHILRAAIGVVGIGGACGFLYGAASDRGGLEAAQRSNINSPVAAILEQYIRSWEESLVFLAALALTMAAILLVWPARRRNNHSDSEGTGMKGARSVGLVIFPMVLVMPVQAAEPPTPGSTTGEWTQESFDASVYPARRSAVKALADQWARDAAAHRRKDPGVIHVGGTTDLAEADYAAAVEVIRSHFPMSEVKYQSGLRGNSEFPNPNDQTLEASYRLQPTIPGGCLVFLGHKMTNVIDKPWVEDFDAFASARSPRRFVIGRSKGPATSEREATEQALESAAGALVPVVRPWLSKTPLGRHAGDNERLAERIQSRLEGNRFGAVVSDRFVQQFQRPYGNVWRTAVLVEASGGHSDRIAQDILVELQREHSRGRRTFAGSVGLIAVTYVLYLLVNSLTKGYFTWRLRTIAAVVIATGVAFLMMLAV